MTGDPFFKKAQEIDVVTLSNLQNKAIKAGAEWFKSVFPGTSSRFYLAGYAGSGKSTILPYFIEEAGIDPKDVAFCAPTGKAAKVMTTKLRSIYPGLDPARTIHSLIYTPGRAKADTLEFRLFELQACLATLQQRALEDGQPLGKSPDEIKLKNEIDMVSTELEAAYCDEEKPNFHLNVESNVRDKRLIVVDEASMVGEEIADDLMRFGVPVFAMGDPAQLQPVGDKPGLTQGDPDFFIDEIHRQAADNPIIWLSQRMRNGEIPKHGDYGGMVKIIKPRDDIYTTDVNFSAQVICGTNKRRWKLTKQIRDAMGYTESGPMKDEPLIICRNSRNIPELVNGTFAWNLTDHGDLSGGVARFALDIETEDTGKVHKINVVQSLFEEHQLRQKNAHTCGSQNMYSAKKKFEHMDWGWVITCHKSQGSQWDRVIVHDESSVFREEALNWLYTSCTRAAEELIIVTP